MEPEKKALSQRFTRLFRLVGVHKERRATLHSCIYFLSGFMNMAYVGYVIAFTDCNMTKVAHFMILQYFYVGTLWTMVYKYPKIMRVAEELDNIVGLDGPEIRQLYVVLTEEMRQSAPASAVRTITIIAVCICSFTCVEPFLKAWAGKKELEFPFTGTNDNLTIFVSIYLMQCSLMFIMASVCIVIFHTLMGSALILMTKYDVIAHELSSLRMTMLDHENVYETKLYRTIQKCAQSHHHILRIFDDYREICSYGFRFSYVGLLGATTLSRTLLSGDDPDLGTIPHIVAELSYIGFFCYILNKLEEQSDKLKHSIYASEWMRMPKQVTSSLRIIMERTERRPYVILYSGGGAANLETFYKLLNGTCAYLIFGMVFDNAI